MDKNTYINQSGFPLQIGLAHAIDASRSTHGWSILHKEHGWENEDTQESGFIDLVVENRHKTVILNVECKRPQEAIWQFLLPNDAPRAKRRCKFWTSYISKSKVTYFDWLDLSIDPESYESEFCIVAGQDSKARPMLERVASTVVSSTEALAREEMPVLRAIDYEHLRVYINVVATTAKLEVCKFNPATVDIQKGTIPSAEYEEVPYIRFRKQLSARPKLLEHLEWTGGFEAISKAKENTVLIVQSSELIGLLQSIELDEQIGHVVARG